MSPVMKQGPDGRWVPMNPVPTAWNVRLEMWVRRVWRKLMRRR